MKLKFFISKTKNKKFEKGIYDHLFRMCKMLLQ